MRKSVSDVLYNYVFPLSHLVASSICPSNQISSDHIYFQLVLLNSSSNFSGHTLYKLVHLYCYWNEAKVTVVTSTGLSLRLLSISADKYSWLSAVIRLCSFSVSLIIYLAWPETHGSNGCNYTGHFEVPKATLLCCRRTKQMLLKSAVRTLNPLLFRQINWDVLLSHLSF